MKKRLFVVFLMSIVLQSTITGCGQREKTSDDIVQDNNAKGDSTKSTMERNTITPAIRLLLDRAANVEGNPHTGMSITAF